MPKPEFNPNNEHDLQALYSADQWSYGRLQTTREHNVRCISQLAGQFYGNQTDAVKVPINLLELAFTIYLRHLSGGTPLVHCTSEFRKLRPYAYELELALNLVFKQIDFGQTLKAGVGNALLSMAPFKIGVEAGENIEQYSEVPFVNAIGVDAWCHDMTADSWGNVQYMRNEYCLVEEIAKETREFKRSESAKLEAADETTINQGGDQKAHSVSAGTSSLAVEGKIHKVVRLKDFWLPHARMLVTVDADGLLTKPLRVVEFDEDQGSPFEVLSYCELQGNTVPLPPSSLWMDLHRMANNIFVKLQNQAHNSRMVTQFSGPDAAADADRMNRTGDGGAFNATGGQKPETFKTNEVDQVLLALEIQVKDLFSYLAGNLDSLGGLGPQSATLGQDQMLLAGASQRLAEMQDRTHEFIGRVARTLAHYEYTGDSTRMLKKKVPETDIEIDVKWDSARRKKMGPLKDYTIDVVPYSSMGVNPAMKLQGMTNVFNTFIAPVLPALQAQGYDINPQQIFEDIARLGNLPELEGWITKTGIPINMQDGENSTPKAANTKRTYERVNRPQSSTRSRDSVMLQSLLGKKVQPGEAGKMLSTG